MVPSSNTDFKRLFSDLIKKEIVILGPDITFAKVRNVNGLKIDSNGDILSITGDPNIILEELINQFVDLSSQIVRKTMETVFSNSPDKIDADLNNEDNHDIQIPTVVEPEPLHTIKVESMTSTPDEENKDNDVESEVEEKPAFIVKVSSPDQRVDPLTQEVRMPGDENKSPQPPKFTISELEELNKSLKENDPEPLITAIPSA